MAYYLKTGHSSNCKYSAKASLIYVLWQKKSRNHPCNSSLQQQKIASRLTLYHTCSSIWPSRTARGNTAAGLVESHPIPSLFQPILDPQHIPLWSCHQWVKYYHNTILAMHFHCTHQNNVSTNFSLVCSNTTHFKHRFTNSLWVNSMAPFIKLLSALLVVIKTVTK